MPTPDPHAIAVMALTVVALYLFSRESMPVETSSLLIVALLAIGFSLFPYDADGEAFESIRFFGGFGNEALIAICALMMASQGLVATGALTPIGRVVSRVWTVSPLLAMGVVLVVTAIASAFMNNTPQVVLMIPILTSVALRSGTSPSKLLMPMTFSGPDRRYGHAHRHVAQSAGDRQRRGAWRRALSHVRFLRARGARRHPWSRLSLADRAATAA